MGTVIFVFLLGVILPSLLLWRVNEGGRKQKEIAVLGPERVANFASYVCGLIYVFYCNRFPVTSNGKMRKRKMREQVCNLV